MSSSAKQQLGNYLILEKIAQGGMAEIYKAKTTDPNGIDRLVVIKRILPHISSNQEYIAMLVDEAKISVHFTHGNIAQVYDLGRVEDDYFIVMEYVDGKTLSQTIKHFSEQKSTIPLDIILFCMAEVCHGLDYIHRKTGLDGKPLGVVHRDISPQNIIVSYSGTVKIIDFGVAKSDVKLDQTESGVLKGKFAYMSPEQTYGEKIDARSDIFSLGILMWELLTQKRLFKRKTNKETVKAIRDYKAPPPSSMRADIPAEIDRIVEKALNKKISRRYQSASEMAQDIMRFLYQLNPEFKSIQIARFLYENFGPEPDEQDIEVKLPALKVEVKSQVKKIGKKNKIINNLEDESTVVDKVPDKKWPWYKKVLVGFFSFLILTILSFFVYVFVMELPSMNKSQLHIKVNQADAQLIINEKEIKLKGGSYTAEYMPKDQAEIQIHLNGYHSFKDTVIFGKKEIKNIEVNLKKKFPAYGDLLIETEPVGATIFINGTEWKQPSPAKIVRLNHNVNYVIQVFIDGYKKEEKSVKIIGGRFQKVKIKLEQDFARLEIKSQPSQALVTIDGNFMGYTPYQLDKIKPYEEISFELNLEGYEKVNKNIVLKPGEISGQMIKLNPIEKTSEK